MHNRIKELEFYVFGKKPDGESNPTKFDLI
jgi:hypothetical protein